MEATKLSVVVCSYNPRQQYLERTLGGLQNQQLPREEWELILVDNNSSPPLSSRVDLSWHPNGSIVVEDQQGLTAARVRGIRESKGEWILFVDDDNVLDPDYLQVLLRLHKVNPAIEVFGGRISAEFEVEPEEWMEPYLSMLAIRDFDRDLWSNHPQQLGFYPCGAGMCISRRVAQTYLEILARDSVRTEMDRKGAHLSSGGDCDICFTAGEVGLGVGVFRSLHLLHLIPEDRLKEPYLLRLAEGIRYSGLLLAYLYDQSTIPPVHTWYWRLRFWRRCLRMSPRERKFAIARARADERAFEFIRKLQST